MSAIKLTNVDNLDALDLEELERHRDVLQLLAAERRPLVVFAHALLGQHLDQGDQFQPVSEVRLQAGNVPVDDLQVLVGPPREGVLLYPLPLGILGQLAFRLHLGLLVVRIVVLAGLLLGRELLVVLGSSLEVGRTI